MTPGRWLPVLLCLTAALAADAQEGLRIGDAVAAGRAVHRSVVEAEAGARSAALALRLAEIDHSGVAVTLSATPAASVDLAPLQTGTFSDVADTFDIGASGTVSAAVGLPWGMEITGSYTGEVDLDGPEPVADSLIDTHSLSVSQDLLPPAGLSASALALSERRDQLRLARLRLWRARNDVALEVARAFLTLTGREVALALAEQRLAFAERDLAHTRSRVEQQAASRLDLLDATIAVAEQRNALAGQRAVLTLDLAEFFADLDLSPGPLTVPEADLDALRRNARALLAEPAPPGAIGTALEVLEAAAALAGAELRAERAQAGLLPELSLSLDYRKPRSASRPGLLSLSITGSYTLYDGGRRTVASEQAQEQAATARRNLTTTRTNVERAFERARLELSTALAAEELAALQLERAHLRLEQARRRHDAGAISTASLEEATLQLREAEADVRAAVLALESAYLSLASDLGLDLQQELTAISR